MRRLLPALLILVVWALEMVFSVSTWIPILATVVIASSALAWLLLLRVRAKRSAAALEQAIAAQGERHVNGIRPDRRGEVEAMQREMTRAMEALKRSPLVRRKGGAAALCSLPWYVIIGPPGAGKTTAIKHSGLEFPFEGTRGGAVRGVGGTRNCDWWFTSEAILLDTAGRYVTEREDRDEWLAFLGMLRKYRGRRPIDGVLVAISVSELIDADARRIESFADKLRARLDEVMTQLQVVVPVYVLFTKCDLVAGFTEIFGDLKRSDRAQAWGATLALDRDRSQPEKLFDEELDLLRARIHKRALERLATARDVEARAKIAQFALELASLQHNLSDFVAAAFAPNAFQTTPILRGFYFTSGTQEGVPIDRVMARMAQAMGIRPHAEPSRPVVEPKSYFLRDVFMKIVFPDAGLAVRRARRPESRRLATAGAFAAALAVTVVGLSSNAFLNNRELLRTTRARVEAATATGWGEGRPALAALDELKRLLDRLKELDGYAADLPLRMGCSMYQGETIRGAATAAYAEIIERACVAPVKEDLEARLARVDGAHFFGERNLLKTYLMLGDVEHLDVDEEARAVTARWARHIDPRLDVDATELRARLLPHVRYYLRLLESRRVAPLPQNEALVRRARDVLREELVQASASPGRRLYHLFVGSVNEERFDDEGGDGPDNRKYPPLTLSSVFANRPEVLLVLGSKQHRRTQRWKEVEGAHTEKGRRAVLQNIAAGAGLLARDRWVVPLVGVERGRELAAQLDRLAAQYSEEYVAQWDQWLRDIVVRPVRTPADAKALYDVLLQPDWPYLRILRLIEDQTQWQAEEGALERLLAQGEVTRRLERRVESAVRGLRIDLDRPRTSAGAGYVPDAFKALIAAGVGPRGAATQTTLARYLSRLEVVRRELDATGDPCPARETLDRATAEARDLLAQVDGRARTFLEPLFTDPLRIAACEPKR